MKEEEWLVCTDPAAMLASLRGQDAAGLPVPYAGGYLPADYTTGKSLISDRKLRLWCAALVSMSSYSYYPNDIFAEWNDGKQSANEKSPGMSPSRQAEMWCQEEMNNEGDPPMPVRANLLREIVGNPWRPMEVRYTVESPDSVPGYRRWIDPSWITTTILAIADAAYHDRRDNGTIDPDALAVLSDALEETGCDNSDILNHLRSKCPACTDCTGFVWGKVANCRKCHGSGEIGPHVRGCHVVDLILGKE